MDKSDFYKFLKKNNLNGVYEIGKYISENYSFGNAISLLGEQFKPIYNAYDIIKENKNVRINCNLNNNQSLRFQIKNTTIEPNRGFIKLFENYDGYPIIMEKTNEYFFFDAILTNTQYQSEIKTTNFGFCFVQDENIPLNENIYNTDNDYKKGEELIQGKYFYANGYFRNENPEPILVNISGFFPKMNAFINVKTADTQILTEREYDYTLRVIMFGIKKFNEINIALYNGERQEIWPLKTIKFNFKPFSDLKLIGNVGYWVTENVTVTKADNFGIVFKDSIDKPKIIEWLKTININRPVYN